MREWDVQGEAVATPIWPSRLFFLFFFLFFLFICRMVKV